MPKAKLNRLKGNIRGQIGRRTGSSPSKTVDSLLDKLENLNFTEEDDHNFDAKKEGELSEGIAQLIVELFSQDLSVVNREAKITELLNHFDEKDGNRTSARTILTSHLAPGFVPTETREVKSAAPVNIEGNDDDALNKLKAEQADKAAKTKKPPQPASQIKVTPPTKADQVELNKKNQQVIAQLKKRQEEKIKPTVPLTTKRISTTAIHKPLKGTILKAFSQKFLEAQFSGNETNELKKLLTTKFSDVSKALLAAENSKDESVLS